MEEKLATVQEHCRELESIDECIFKLDKILQDTKINSNEFTFHFFGEFKYSEINIYSEWLTDHVDTKEAEQLCNSVGNMLVHFMIETKRMLKKRRVDIYNEIKETVE